LHNEQPDRPGRFAQAPGALRPGNIYEVTSPIRACLRQERRRCRRQRATLQQQPDGWPSRTFNECLPDLEGRIQTLSLSAAQILDRRDYFHYVPARKASRRSASRCCWARPIRNCDTPTR
jgi:hypothetical protein